MVILIAALAFFLYSLFEAYRAGKNGPASGNTRKSSTSQLKIKSENDGVHVIFPPGTLSIEDSSEDLFPDIINDIAPDDDGLDEIFWQKVASIPETEDPEERERIATRLADAGIISRDKISTVALLGPQDIQEAEARRQAATEKDVMPSPQPPTEAPVESPEPLPVPEAEPLPEPMPAATPQPEPLPAPQPSQEEEGVSREDFAQHEFNL